MIKSIEKLKFFIGGYFSENFEFILIDNTVELANTEYDSIHPDNLAKKEITTTERSDFLQALNTVEVLKWKRNYMDMDVLDGTQWELEISYNQGKKKKISGSNAYPGIMSDEMEYTKEFITLLKALDVLLGREYFYSEEKED